MSSNNIYIIDIAFCQKYQLFVFESQDETTIASLIWNLIKKKNR